MPRHPDRGVRRPYRVVFTPAGEENGRRGVIVARDLEGAIAEASKIALAGGHAQVHYIGEDGARSMLAEYPDDDPPHRDRRTSGG